MVQPASTNSGTNIEGGSAGEAGQVEETLGARTGPLSGDPAILGVPAFIVGSIALGLGLVGYVPPSAAGAALPIILGATAGGQLLAALWSAALGESAVAGVFGLFAGFWISYPLLVLGLTHNWYGIDAADATRTQVLYLGSWLVGFLLLTVGTLRLPSAFTLLFVLVDIAFALILVGTAQGSTTLTKAGGYVVFSFVLVGCYLYLNALSLATGGRAYNLGRPVIHP